MRMPYNQHRKFMPDDLTTIEQSSASCRIMYFKLIHWNGEVLCHILHFMEKRLN